MAGLIIVWLVDRVLARGFVKGERDAVHRRSCRAEMQPQGARVRSGDRAESDHQMAASAVTRVLPLSPECSRGQHAETGASVRAATESTLALH